MSPVAFDDWADRPEHQTPEERRAIASRGLFRGRQVLAAKGVAPPVDESHSHMYDPPLSVPETRHWAHVRFGTPHAECRFCVTGTGQDVTEGGTR